MRKLLIFLLFACCATFGQQTNSDIIPATSGLNLGRSNQRWNGYLQNLDINGTCTINGSPCLGAGPGGNGIVITNAAGLSTVPGKQNGTIAVITDGLTFSDCTIGGGITNVVCQFNGSTWSQLPVNANFASPPPLGNVAPNTVGATTVTVNGDGLFFQPQSNCIFEGSDPTLHELEDVSGNLMWLFQGLGGPCRQILTYTPLPDGVNPSDKQVIAYDAASGAWTVQSQTSGGTPGGSNGQTQYNNAGSFGGYTMGGDCTINTGTGVITCTKTNGTTFSAAWIVSLFSACSGTQYLGADGGCHNPVVASVFGRAGAVTAQSGDYTCAQVTGCPPATTGYYVLGNGLVCDGTTDDTAALNTLLATVNTAGGGSVIFPQGHTCKFSSAEITLPNNGDTLPNGDSSQAPVHWTCDSQNYQVFQPDLTQNGCVLDLEFNATHAKLVALGAGHWEVDHLTFVDNNTDCASFFWITNTIPDFHDNSIIGSTASVNGGPYSCNDVFILGGPGATNANKTTNAWFQGYPNARIANNFFNQVKRVAVFNNAAQTIMVLNNTVWSKAGCASCGVFELPGTSVYSNTFSYNNLETTHYPYGVNITNSANATLVIGQTCSDSSEFATECVRSTGTDTGTQIIGGVAPAGKMFSTSNTSFNAWVLNTGGSVWRDTLHLNAFLNLSERSDTPNGTGATEALFGSAFSQRPRFTKWHLGTQFDVVGLQEIPTTQTSTASDNFTRANAASLGANWTAITSLSSLQILTNNAEAQTTSAYNGNYYTNITFPADQWSQCTVGSAISNSNAFALCLVRVQSGAESFYSLWMRTDGGQCTLKKFTAGATADIATCSPVSVHGGALLAGDTLTITAVGNTITGYQNGVQIVQGTDSSFTTGSPGIAAFPNLTLGNVTYSAWSGGYMNCQSGVVTGLVLGSSATCTPSPALAGLNLSANSNVGTMLISATAPTISSGFGTSPSVVNSNGPSAFTVNVGTGGSATSGVIGLPAATTGWSCFANDRSTNVATRQTATATTTATFTAASAWTASDILNVSCFAY